MHKKWFLVFASLIALALVLVACSEPTEVQVEVTREVQVEVEVPMEVTVEVPGPEVEVTRIVEIIAEPEGPPHAVPFEELWLGSGHADASAEAFVHWDEDDPAEIPTSCARCHSTPGYLDYIGADGTEAGSVESAAPIGTVISCEACHNETTVAMDSVVFPSGVEVTDLGPEARCMQCHQGRHSTVSVNESIANAGLTDDVDAVSEDLGFSNIHYYAAAATLYGSVTMGGYEYDGKAYDSKFDHVAGYETCTGCHNPHTLEVKLDECTACHGDLESTDDLIDIRMPGSLVDYDGDGDISEGVYYEIEGMREILYTAIQAYAADVAGTPMIYDSHAYPYFFIDTNGDGVADEDEANYGNRFNAWTARLAKAAYNYQVSLKDPGRFAHGGKYIIQLLYDSIEDLNAGLATPIDMSGLNRIDSGHFAGSEEAFRHWDEDDYIVSGRCSRCHSAAGLPLYLEQGVTINQPAANGLNCATCHNDLTTFSRYTSEEVEFPSGATVSFGEDDMESNLCINCHQGRSSGDSVAGAIAGLGPDEVGGLRFINIHYFPAGATLFGADVNGAFQYEGKEYVGQNEHVGRADSCTECHSTHALTVQVENVCADCHDVSTIEDLKGIMEQEVDFDGDGEVEGLGAEIDGLGEMLYAQILAYSNSTEGVMPIVYNSHRYPYFFVDANADGVVDEGDTERYSTFTPNLLGAVYNYQYYRKDPGAFAHNGLYIIQVLYDSIESLGGDVSGLTRP